MIQAGDWEVMQRDWPDFGSFKDEFKKAKVICEGKSEFRLSESLLFRHGKASTLWLGSLGGTPIHQRNSCDDGQESSPVIKMQGLAVPDPP